MRNQDFSWTVDNLGFSWTWGKNAEKIMGVWGPDVELHVGAAIDHQCSLTRTLFCAKNSWTAFTAPLFEFFFFLLGQAGENTIFKEHPFVLSHDTIVELKLDNILFHRLLWIVALLGMLGWMCYQIASRIDEFIHKPISVNIEFINNKTMKFPAVSICNTNMYR